MKKKILLTLLALAILALGACAVVRDLSNDSDDTKNTTANTREETIGGLAWPIEGPWSKWDPNDNLTVIKAIAMASQLHATYRGAEISAEKHVEEYRYDFDDPSILVGEFDRNENGINLFNGTAKIENGILEVQAAGRWDNPSIFDTQVFFAGLDLPAKDFNKISFRMKRDYLPNADPDAERSETVEIYFSTSLSQVFSEDKCIRVDLNGYTDDLAEWFDVEIELGRVTQWRDIINNLRFDPTNNNGIYYLDYLVLSKSDKINNSKWYDMYLDYAVENSLIALDTYKLSEYNRSITRYELFDLLIKSLPDECYTPINHIKGIPDVSRDRKNADAYLMLYNAGIYFGDYQGNLNGSSEIKIGETMEIIHRMEHPENRIKVEGSFDWSTQGSEYDIEFDDEVCLEKLDVEANSIKVINGALAVESSDSSKRIQIDIKNLNIEAESLFKFRVRMKAKFACDVHAANFGLYFGTTKYTAFIEANAFHDNYVEKSYVDPAGWYIIEVNLYEHPAWEGTITDLRFVPSDQSGIYTIDYIRIIKRDTLHNASHEELLSQGYTPYNMLHDNGFENGFVVSHYEHKPIDRNERVWNDYVETGKKPDWDLMSLWTLYDLWDTRDYTVNKYTLADKVGINTVVYDPEEKSLSLRLNATKVYNGEPHDSNFSWWPHLLINQEYMTYPVDKVKNSAAADRIFVELDMRVTDFKNTTNPKGSNSCIFPLFFYLVTDKAPNQKIWFGISLFHTAANNTRVPAWAPDSAAHQYIYGIPPAAVFGDLANSFNPRPGKVAVGDEWKHIRVDITDYIDQCLEWANRDEAFGFGLNLTKEDMYFGGCNIGFEIHGNYDCTVEIKNLDMISYNKD